MNKETVMNIPSSRASDDSARKNLSWLFVLRNLMIFGEALTIFISVYGLDIQLHQAALAGIITLLSGFNWYTWMRLSNKDPVTDNELFVQLVCDVLGITAILYFTGGATNPIAWFFLLPLIIAATVLPQAYTWYMVVFTSACYTILMGFYEPLPRIVPMTLSGEAPAHIHDLIEHHDIELHAFGMWFGFVFSAVLVAYFVVEMADTLRERDRNLAEVREQTLRNEQVVALGTLAASAAHEMGTPLGTMAIIIHELEQEYKQTRSLDHLKKMEILRIQISRCKEALSVMSASAGEIRAESGHMMPIARFLDEVVDTWKHQGLKAKLVYRREGYTPSPNLLAERTLSYALINILNNAAEVSPQQVIFKSRWSKEQAILEILDEGPGIDPNIIERLGKAPVSSKENGLGVGLFLAFSAIERLGGQIDMRPRHNHPGTLTRITLPLDVDKA